MELDTPLEDIVETIIFRARTPTIRQVEFKWQLTPFVKSELERINPNVDFSRVE